MNPVLQSDFNTCATRLPEGSVERQYHEAVLLVLSGIEFPRTLDVGMALFAFLQTADFVVGDVDTRVHPAAGSHCEDADLIACVFREVQDDPDWWLANYQVRSVDDHARQLPLIRFWYASFNASSFVSTLRQ